MSGERPHDLAFTDEDGARLLVTADPETCEGAGVSYPLVIAIPDDGGTGGVFISRGQAKELRDFIDATLDQGGQR